MCLIHKLLFCVIIDAARSGKVFDVILSHASVSSGAAKIELESSITLCGLKCIYNMNCVAYDICKDVNGLSTCTTIQNMTSFISNVSPNTDGECKTFIQHGHYLFACNNRGTWSSENGRCVCQPNICGHWCENDCTTSLSQELTTAMDTTVTTVPKKECPTSFGYTMVENPQMCYKVNFTRSTWFVANETCVSEGAQLLMLHTEDRWVYWNQTSPVLDDLEYGFWIGGNDLAVEGQWEWSDGSLFTDHTFTKWGKMYHGIWKYEPDNFGGKDNCLRFYLAIHPHYPAYPETEYTWHDDWCAEAWLYFICEISID